jgi:predicted Zn finger-like uncharacterized protein
MWAEAPMKLTCPNCSSRFKIKDDALGTKGRKVKCGKCEHRWHAMPEAAPAPAAAPAEPTEDFAPPPPPPPVPQVAPVADDPDVDDDEDDDYDDDEVGVPDAMLADPPPIPPESSFVLRNRNPEPQGGGTLKYWILLILILASGSGAAFWWRDTVVHHFPAANKAFMMVGYPANTIGYGLKIFEPKTFLNVKGRKRIFSVSGQIMNETGKIIEVPFLKAILIGTKGEDVMSWSFEAKEPRILPGEKVEYETMTENPPRGATGLRIMFTRTEESEAMKDEMMSKEPKN